MFSRREDHVEKVRAATALELALGTFLCSCLPATGAACCAQAPIRYLWPAVTTTVVAEPASALLLGLSDVLELACACVLCRWY
jgi:hypothetical protein